MGTLLNMADPPDIGTIGTLFGLLTANAANPTELNAIGTTTGDLRCVYDAQVGNDSTTWYRLDTSTAAVNAPYTMASATAGKRWVAFAGTYSALPANFGSTLAVTGAATLTGGLTITTTGVSITDVNVALGTTTGTKFGTATTQKLAFFNAAPVVQQTGDLVTALGNLGLVTSGTVALATTATTATTANSALDGTFVIKNTADNTKQFNWSLSGMTTGKTLTIASAQTTSQTLNLPNIAATDTLATLGLSQTWTGAPTFSGGLTASGSFYQIVATGGASAAGGVRILSTLSSSSAGVYCENDLANQVRFQMVGSTAASHAGQALLVMTGATTLTATQNGNDIWSYGSSGITTLPTTGTGLAVKSTTAASSSITGAVIIGDGATAATNVGIGGGKIYSAQQFITSAVGVDALTISDATWYTLAVRRIPSVTGALIGATAGAAFGLMSNNTEAMRFDTSGNATVFSATDATAIGSAGLIVTGGATFAKSIGLGLIAAPGTLFLGQIWNDSTRQALLANLGASTANKLQTTIPGVICTTVPVNQISNSSAEQSLLGSLTGTNSVPANFLTVGKQLRLKVAGVVSNGGGGNFTFKAKIGSTAVTIGGGALTGALSSAYFEGEAIFTVQTAGSGGTFACTAKFSYNNGGTMQVLGGTNSALAVNTTIANSFDYTETMSVASASNIIWVYSGSLEILN